MAVAENVAKDPRFNLKRITVIFIHGWNQSPSSPATKVVLDAYIKNGRYNILAVDWSQAADGPYFTVRSRVDEVCNGKVKYLAITLHSESQEY